MSFDLTAAPDGDYPDTYDTKTGNWPDDEYTQSPHFSAKYVRDSPLITDTIVVGLTGRITPPAAIGIATQIESIIDNNLDHDDTHLGDLHRLVRFLRYWGEQNASILGGP